MVIDNTNPVVAEREKYIRRAKEAGYQVVGYFTQSRLQECIARNELREGKEKIPSKAIAATSICKADLRVCSYVQTIKKQQHTISRAEKPMIG